MLNMPSTNYSAADVFGNLLNAKGLGKRPPAAGVQWGVSIGHQNSTEECCLSVYDTAAISDGRIMSTGERIEHPGIQVRIRATNYPQGWAKAWEICKLMDATVREPVTMPDGAVRMDAITRKGRPIPLGFEPGGRLVLFVINATMTLSEP
jgi:Bacteriophage minor capsid protein